MLLFPYNSKTRGERPKFQIHILHRKIKLTKPNLLITSKLLVFHAQGVSALSNTLFL